MMIKQHRSNVLGRRALGARKENKEGLRVSGVKPVRTPWGREESSFRQCVRGRRPSAGADLINVVREGDVSWSPFAFACVVVHSGCLVRGIGACGKRT